MPVDKQIQAFLDQLAASGLPPLHTLPVEAARQAAVALAEMGGPAEAVAAVEEHSIPGPGGSLCLRVYTPACAGPLPVLVYFHGGGWVIGNLDTHDRVCRSLANAAACLVVAVDYRLAPEHKFPAAAEDAYAATVWVVKHAANLGGNGRLVAVGGDSAGGNLSAAVTLMARDRQGPDLCFQLLVYPVTDAACDTLSYRENGSGYLLTQEMMQWFWDQYLAGPADGRHPYASPLRAPDVRDLPAALIITAEFDPLRDEGEAYARRLRETGGSVTLTRYAGMIHGFFGMTGLVDQARTATREAGAALRAGFASRR